jgi:hypothetical protein
VVPRMLAKSGRSVLCWSIAGYLLLQAGIHVAVERQRAATLGPRSVSPGTEPSRDVVDGRGRRTTLVMLGSSRTMNGLKPELLESCLAELATGAIVVLNHGMPGAGPGTELIMLRRLLQQGLRPDFVLVEVVPTQLAARPALDNQAQELAIDWLYFDELLAVQEHRLPDAQRMLTQCVIAPAYAHRIKLMNAVSPRWLPHDRKTWHQRWQSCAWHPWGWNETVPTPEAYRRGVEQAWAEHGEILQHFQLGTHACAVLRQLLDTCQDQRIPFALVLMPEGSEFRSWYPPTVWERVLGFLEDLSREHDVPLVNAREWVADEHFADAHHLLRTGAEIFTERLGREFVSPWLARELRSAPHVVTARANAMR